MKKSAKRKAMVRGATSDTLDVPSARRALAACRTPQQAKDLRDKAEAMRKYLRAAGAGLEKQNDAAEIKIHAERKLGELLDETIAHKGGRKRLRDATVSLGDLGVEKTLSLRCQRVALVPERLLAKYTKARRAAREEITTADVLRIAAAIRDAPASVVSAVEDAVTAGEAPGKAAHAAKVADIKAEAAAAAPQGAYVRHCSARELLESFEPESVDLLLTDPPYRTDLQEFGVESIEAFVRDWVPLALSRVKPTGRAYICTGAYPDELHAYLSEFAQQERMTLGNVLVWTYRNTIGPGRNLDYKQNWQAVFHLRGPDAPSLDCPELTELFSVQDINAPDGRQGDRYHTWQKPEELAERFIRHSTKPGDLVVDPFVCTGTFVLAAARLGRRAIGGDVSAEHLEIARSRGCTLEAPIRAA
jgi:site-specific DNA-methyltransferase (adenine-specific)